MRNIIAVMTSVLAALAVQPLVLFLWAFIPLLLQGAELPWNQVGVMCLMAMLFAAPFIVVLGIPSALLLQRSGRLKWWPLALIGTVAGMIFVAWSGPGSDSGFSSGGNWYGKHVDFVVNGKPTLYGWLSYLQSVVAFGLHGLAGATAFYFSWVHSLGPNNSFKPRPLRGSA